MHFEVYSAVVDPLVPLHVYTGGLLPPAPPALPRWAVDAALRRFGTVVGAGPLVVPEVRPSAAAAANAVQMAVPSPLGIWAWLQPSEIEAIDDLRHGRKEEEGMTGF
ncbi:hypothetical protein N657DRAFT_649871 [Parathielavia appendiculata]|uniref:Uncharacterized protein n=1 Tax=Parathielavia appendiculata TaxID=2587402 RepID=A0AAN6YZC2_9PEZI|nr:hypothetical protein N657DRAFT_649871 [Parathielavia appendiculata]